MALSKIYCSCCGREQNEREFLFSSSKLHAHTSKLPLCKSCLNKRFKELHAQYNGDVKQALQHFCYNLDLYYDEEILNSMENEKINVFAVEYIKEINRHRSNREKTSIGNPLYFLSSSQVFNNESEPVGYAETADTKPFVASKEVLRRWGRNKFSPDELEMLEYKYEELISEYPSEKYQEREIIKDICQIEIKLDKMYKNDDQSNYVKLLDQKSKKMEQLNVIPSKQKQYGEDKSMTLGQLIRRIEEEEPIPDTSEEFEDIDRIKFLINRYFTAPMRKVLGIDKAEYTIEDEMNTYENYIEKKKKPQEAE